MYTELLTYSSKTKHDETKAWFRGLLHHPAKKQIAPILQLLGLNKANHIRHPCELNQYKCKLGG